MTHFILCSGLAQSGKDTSAQIIKNDLESRGYSVLITHYADLLKFICRNFFGWNGNKDEVGRTLLQRIGTDCVRAQDPDYWVDFIVNIIRMFPSEFDYVIIPDMRFPNELDRIVDAGFPVTHVHIARPGFDNLLTDEQKKHPSENSLNKVVPDHLITNTTMAALQEQLRLVCGCIVAERKEFNSESN